MTAPHTPQQNGVVERKFVTIRNRACASMFAANFSDESQGLLWAKTISMHTRLTNIVSNSRNVRCPDWLFYGKQPTIYTHLVQFGRIGWVTICTKTNKLDKKAKKCVMIGYADNHAGDTYRMYDPATKKVLDTRDLTWADWHGLTPDTNMSTFNNIAPVATTDDIGIGFDEFEDDEPDDKNNTPPQTTIPDVNAAPIAPIAPIIAPPTVRIAPDPPTPPASLAACATSTSFELGRNDPPASRDTRDTSAWKSGGSKYFEVYDLASVPRTEEVEYLG